jgi:general secretion pathway protein D
MKTSSQETCIWRETIQTGIVVFMCVFVGGLAHAAPDPAKPGAPDIAKLSALAAASKAAASQTATPQSATSNVDASQKITIAFDNADVKDVIRWASDLTEKSIIIHPGVAGKKISVVAGDPLTRAEAWQVLLSTLQLNGIAVMESEDTVKILPEQEAKSEKIPMSDEGRKSGQEDMVVRIIKVKNLAATQLINLLKPLTPQSAHFAAYPETNTIILADRAGNIERIVDIISNIDKAGTIDIEIIKLEFASSKDVAKILTDLVSKSAPGGKDAPPSQAINIVADERSNSILMTGDPVLRVQLRNLISRLDQPLAGDGNTQVVYLNYITAKEIQPILEGVGGSSKGGAGKEGTPANDVEVSVQALEETNAIVITAPPSTLNTMKGVIAKLDVRRKQVLVEALIVEVGMDVGRDLGIFWRGNQTDNGRFVGNFPGRNVSEAPDFTKTITSGGMSLGYFSGDSFRAAIRAIENDANTNILSTPTIIALDNEEAKILVGESVPFRTGVENSSDDNITTGGGGIGTPDFQRYNNDFVSIDRQDIGIQLEVTPRINQEDMITLEIEQKVENISDSTIDSSSGASGAADIITNKREIKTTALVRNDQVLVLGGLMRDEIISSDNGVPYLKNIPYLGRLFKGSSKSVVKRNLMVFIHPRILRDDEENADESGNRYETLRQDQLKFNAREMNDGFRVNKPLPELDKWPHEHVDLLEEVVPAVTEGEVTEVVPEDEPVSGPKAEKP